MVGAIVLTLRHRSRVKRQDMAAQVRAHQGEAMEVVKVRPGQGLHHDHRLGHYLAVAAILFTLGILGIFINRKNVIVILMSIELILLAVNINLVAFSSFLGDLVGQVFALLVLTVAAAEAAIGSRSWSCISAPRLDRGRGHQPDEGLSLHVSGDRLLPLLGCIVAA
jgi:NADH-quinone oxidoreductase subunit K